MIESVRAPWVVLEVLLVAAWLVPFLIALLWAIPRLGGVGVRLAPWAALPAGLLAILGNAGGDDTLRAHLPFLFTGLRLEMDATGQAFLLFTSVLWLAAGIFARSYHARDPRRSGFFFLFSLTMTGNLGLVLSGDVLSFYLFFALMTFAAYGLVIHDRDGAAMRAGRIYIILAVLGELALLSGLFSLGQAFGGAPLFGAETEGAWRLLAADESSPLPLLVTGTLVAIGFGVKAGLVPLHLWLPLAHPVAPTAASALLSGAMIKAGLLGWIRVLPEDSALPLLAGGFLVLGATSALYGVIMGIAQDDPKTVLAYSSISQMGYMAMGAGLLVGDPELAPLALLGIVAYALHHGVAKGALFLSVGLVDRAASTRWILAGAMLPAVALAGLPLTSGNLAKNLLKGGIEGAGGMTYVILDPLLLVAAFGTTLLMARFLVTLGHRSRTKDRKPERDLRGLALPWGALVAFGVTGIVWIPRALEVPDDILMPGPFDDWLVALLPVLAGALCGWIVYRLMPPTSRSVPRIPAGDLLIPIERGLGRIPLIDQERAIEQAGSAIRRRARTGRVVFEMLERWARRDVRSIEGPVLGLLLFGIALLMIATLL